MSLAQIRETRAAKVADMRRLLSVAETEKRSLNANEQTQFDGLKTEITGLEQSEARTLFLEDAERRSMGTPVGDKHATSLERSVNVVEVIRAKMEGRSLDGAALEYQQETERRTGRKAEGVFVPMSAIEQRVQTAGNDTAGGYLVGTDHRADQFIEPFRNSLLARKLGVRVLPGLSGNVAIPKHGTGTTVGWVAENSSLPTGDMSFGNVSLTPRHAGGITELSRQLIMQSSPAAEQLVRDDLSAMLAQALDSAIIKGGGTNEPVGVLSTVGIQTSSLSALGWADIVAMLQKLELVNATPNAWLMGPNPKAKLMSILDSTGLPAKFLDNGRMANLPAFSTNQVPDKTGTPNKGRVILGDWSQVLLGIWSEVDILVNPYESTAYGRGGVLVRAMTTCDIAIRHAEGFVVADDIILA